MAITAALLGLSVGCYAFGVLYSPWSKDYRTERQLDASPWPADEVSSLMFHIPATMSVLIVHSCWLGQLRG